VAGVTSAINPEQFGTKASAHYRLHIAPGGTAVVRLRLTPNPLSEDSFTHAFDEICAERVREADEFYQTRAPL